jgi:hypothetical protein
MLRLQHTIPCRFSFQYVLHLLFAKITIEMKNLKIALLHFVSHQYILFSHSISNYGNKISKQFLFVFVQKSEHVQKMKEKVENIVDEKEKAKNELKN